MPDPVAPGLYESLVTARLEKRLAELSERLAARRSELHQAEAPNRIALHLGRVVERAIASIAEAKRSQRGLEVARSCCVVWMSSSRGSTLSWMRPWRRRPFCGPFWGGSRMARLAEVETPLIPLLDTTLLTNAPGEPHVGRQLRAEIASADRIDVLMAFVRKTGIAPVAREPAAALRARAKLRVLTTTYTGSTEQQALDLLQASSAPRSGCRTTPAARGCTPRPGCSTAGRGSRRPTSARRT